MQRRQILTNGTKVSQIGVGCMSFSGGYGRTDMASSHATLDAARDIGIDFLDTANIYGQGRSEEVIGAYIQKNGNPFLIASKAGITRAKPPHGKAFDNSAAYLRAELEGSLKRLHCERIDLFYIHRRDHSIPIEEVMQTLLRLKQEGKIGGIGFSEISPTSLRRAAVIGPVDAVQSEYSLWTRNPDLGLVRVCKELNTAFIAFSPLGRGMFTDTPPKPAHFAAHDIRRNMPRFHGLNLTKNQEKCGALRKLARAHSLPTATLALSWCLAQAPHVLPIPGTRDMHHLAELAQADESLITGELKDTINRLMPSGWASGARYGDAQWAGVEPYC